MMPSPMNLSSVPPEAKIVSTMRAWHSLSMATTWSLVNDSLRAVKSRRSLKRIVTSRLSPAPTSPYSSSRAATGGEVERRQACGEDRSHRQADVHPAEVRQQYRHPGGDHRREVDVRVLQGE